MAKLVDIGALSTVKVQAQIAAITTRDVPARVRAAVGKVAIRIQGEIRKRIQRRGSKFKAYRRGRKLHWSSAPGMTPNTDTGNLVSSIVVDLAPEKQTAFVRCLATYGRALEFGSKHARGGSRWLVAPRPFFRPVLRDLMPWIRRTILEATRTAR